jgi:hypothetical protein
VDLGVAVAPYILEDCSDCAPCPYDPDMRKFYSAGAGNERVWGDLTGWGCIEEDCDQLLPCPPGGSGPPTEDAEEVLALVQAGDVDGLRRAISQQAGWSYDADSNALWAQGCNETLSAFIPLDGLVDLL